MPTPSLASILPPLFAELTLGSPNPESQTYMLNRGDLGLLASLALITAEAASKTPLAGAPVCAHVEHLRYGLSLLNRWASGEPEPWSTADWTLAWQKTHVTDDEWQSLRDDLGREVHAWLSVLSTDRDLPPAAACWVAGSVAHTAYHLGAIRQINRAMHGPTAEDEKPFQQQAR